MSIHHNAYEGPRWFWGSGSGVWDYAQHGPVRAAVRPRHAQRLTRCARDAAPGVSSVEALQGLFRRHPQMLLQGREQYVLERARMGPSPEALRVRRQRQEERAAARAVRQQQAREALAEKRAQEEAMRLKDLLLWWAETREVREAAREAVVVAALLVSEAPSAEGMAAAKRKVVADVQVPAAKRVAAPPQLTSEEVWQQAQAAGLTLRHVKGNKTGYFGVNLNRSRKLTKPYSVQVSRGGQLRLSRGGCAVSVARSAEGQAAAERAAAAPAPLASDNGVGDGAGMKEGETETEEEEEEEATIQVLDAIEVDPLTATDDDEMW